MKRNFNGGKIQKHQTKRCKCDETRAVMEVRPISLEIWMWTVGHSLRDPSSLWFVGSYRTTMRKKFKDSRISKTAELFNTRTLNQQNSECFILTHPCIYSKTHTHARQFSFLWDLSVQQSREQNTVIYQCSPSSSWLMHAHTHARTHTNNSSS